MKNLSAAIFLGLISLAAFGQHDKRNNTLLWKISGNGLSQPSYLYGTIHLICAEDAMLSDSLTRVIRECDEVYFEVDLDNFFEMIGAIGKMKMRGDTTLRDLLSEEDYARVKEYFERRQPLLPFSLLETFKPMLAASTLQESGLACENTAMMEQLILEEANRHGKKIRGLESMAYQAGVLDSIPYRVQAEQLLRYIRSNSSGDSRDEELDQMMKAYREQDLARLEELLNHPDAGIAEFAEPLLYNRNENWVRKLKQLLPKKSLLIAVGAGHLPGERGVISLLRKEGFTVTPVPNKLNKTRVI